MRRAPPVVLNQSQRSQLQAWCRGGSTPFRIVIRSWIVLLAASGKSDRDICRILRTNPITVARWRSRFVLFGPEGIRTEAPHTGAPASISEATTRRIIRKTLKEQARDGRCWSTRSLAREAGVSHTTVQRIWKAQGLRPKRRRSIRLAPDVHFPSTALDLGGVYVNPPHRAVALTFDRGPNTTGGSSHPRPRSRVPLAHHEGPWIMDLIAGLDSLEQHELSYRSRRYLDAELLTFVRSVLERNKAKEKIVVLLASDTPNVPRSLARWLGRHAHVSAEISPGVEAWKRRLFLSARSGPDSELVGMVPAGLPEFLSAVNRWRQAGLKGSGPFAWIEERPLKAS